MNTLVLTSCNRIEQVLLSIAINKEIIKNPFNLVVVDCSTPNLSVEDAIKMHTSDDSHNLVNCETYNSNWEILEDYIKTISKIVSYKIIHVSPRMNKQIGDAYLTAIGIITASLMNSDTILKLTGVCQLTYDIFSKLEKEIESVDIITWKRTSFHDQLSTRIFVGNSKNISIALINSGYKDWINDYDFLEFKFRKIIDKYLTHCHTNLDESDILVDKGFGGFCTRELIILNLKEHNLLESKDPQIIKFLNE